MRAPIIPSPLPIAPLSAPLRRLHTRTRTHARTHSEHNWNVNARTRTHLHTHARAHANVVGALFDYPRISRCTKQHHTASAASVQLERKDYPTNDQQSGGGGGDGVDGDGDGDDNNGRPITINQKHDVYLHMHDIFPPVLRGRRRRRRYSNRTHFW